MTPDRRYLLTALLFGALGLGLGQYMGASGHHEQHVTHAHILLVGFVMSMMYALIHKLWLGPVSTGWNAIQYGLHVLGALGMAAGLLLMYAGLMPESQAGPVLGGSSAFVMVALLMMLAKVFQGSKN